MASAPVLDLRTLFEMIQCCHVPPIVPCLTYLPHSAPSWLDMHERLTHVIITGTVCTPSQTNCRLWILVTRILVARRRLGGVGR